MVRQRLCRRVRFNPKVTYFKSWGIPLRELKEVILPVDEDEAVGLKDLEGLDQKECAKKITILLFQVKTNALISKIFFLEK